MDDYVNDLCAPNKNKHKIIIIITQVVISGPGGRNSMENTYVRIRRSECGSIVPSALNGVLKKAKNTNDEMQDTLLRCYC